MSKKKLKTEPKFDLIPEELKDRDQWILWRGEERDDEKTKIPYQPSGNHASTKEPDTWSTFLEVSNLYRKQDYDGIGFVFTEEDLLVGIDLDDCRDPSTGEIKDKFEEIIENVNSYTEISPSGTGLHIIAKGFKPDGGNRKDDVEIYDNSRYFTFTGKHLDGTPESIKTRRKEVSAVHEEHVDSKEEKDNSVLGDVEEPVDLDDKELIEKAKDSKNGQKFEQLWNGSTAGYQSHSEADQALCNILAFWTRGDYNRIQTLFSRSGLSRQKWDNRRDYRKRTINNAINQVTEYYDPEKSNEPPAITPATREPEEDGSEGEVSGYSFKQFVPPDGFDSLNKTKQAYYLAEWLSKDLYIRMVYQDDYSELWAYDFEDKVWNSNGEQKAKEYLRKARGTEYSRHLKNETIDQLEAINPIPREKLGAPEGKIPVKNSLLDLNNKKLEEIKPEDYLLYKIPVAYSAEADCENFKKRVKEWVPQKEDEPNDKVVQKLQEYIGYSLVHWNCKHEKALFLLGPRNSGKSLFLDVMQEFYGGENVCNHDIQYLANDKWGVVDLGRKVANIRQELSTKSIHNIGIVKEIISGNRLKGERKGQQPRFVKPLAKHLYSANQPPSQQPEDLAFYDRWLMVTFPNTVDKEDQVDRQKLFNQLTTDEELSGILNWALEGLENLEDQGHFTGEMEPDAVRQLWQSWGSSVEDFKKDYMVKENGAKCKTKTAYDVYELYAKLRGLDIESRSEFTKQVNKDRDVNKYATKWEEDKVQTFHNIRLQPGAEEELRNLTGEIKDERNTPQ